jgi:hypothetical protein
LSIQKDLTDAKNHPANIFPLTNPGNGTSGAANHNDERIPTILIRYLPWTKQLNPLTTNCIYLDVAILASEAQHPEKDILLIEKGMPDPDHKISLATSLSASQHPLVSSLSDWIRFQQNRMKAQKGMRTRRKGLKGGWK